MTMIKLLQRADTKDNWQRSNPIISNKEVVYELDSTSYNMGSIKHGATRCKIGDGVTHYNSLPYVGITYVDVSNVFAKKTDVKIVGGWELNTWEDIEMGIDEGAKTGIYLATEDAGGGFEHASVDVEVWDENNAVALVKREDGIYTLRKKTGVWLEPAKMVSNQKQCRITASSGMLISGGAPQMIAIRGLVERKSEPFTLKKIDCILRMETTTYNVVGNYEGLSFQMEGTQMTIRVSNTDMGTYNAGATLIVETLTI